MRKDNIFVDCIIAYDPIASGFIGGILKKILNSKLIVEINGDYTSKVVWGDSKSAYFGRLKHYISMVMSRKVLAAADAVKLLNGKQYESYSWALSNKKVATFHSWVPISYFRNIDHRKEILFIGFPFYIKGVDILIESFKKISKSFPDWKLKIMGWYPDKTLLEKAMGNHSQIYYQKPVPYFEVPEHIGRCGFLVLPSRTEAMGRVLLEAAAASKARIGSNVDGIPAVIIDGHDGFLFEAENVSDLSVKMAMLMRDDELRKKIGLAAHMRVTADFSEKLYMDKYRELILDSIK